MKGDDVLYIIVTAIILLTGLLKKNKKANQKKSDQPAPAQTVNKPAKDFEDWFAVVEKPEPVQKKKIAKKNIFPPTRPNGTNEDVFGGSERMQKKIETQIKTKTKTHIPANNTDDVHEQIELTTAEDARRAFIYSEIFQRKY